MSETTQTNLIEIPHVKAYAVQRVDLYTVALERRPLQLVDVRIVQEDQGAVGARIFDDRILSLHAHIVRLVDELVAIRLVANHRRIQFRTCCLESRMANVVWTVF